ncbi:putative pentatricopeptide repeat-containing protein At1g09680 [Cajanus cajan]|uniref:Pentatricopeptide repeat-containing protein At1g09680 family n=1 Tax=Cajanus cajan TaxID=3821 RepID=A0A151QP46_CAJCA|nr:putative pentatricopeptide repeat-containing protein At1g09680 [Cajanus cajan]KYP32056.1 Putative pentatricopeptide repeat-containing protein At1g09680 family [Cajanus cajan]
MAMGMSRKLKPKLWKTSHRDEFESLRSFIDFHHLPFSSLSPDPYKDHDDLLRAISEAILESETKRHDYSQNPKLRRILPSLTPRHVSNLITLNPLSLSPCSLLSFFNYLASRPPFRHTLHSYCTMLHFLSLHRMLPQAHSLLSFLVSRKGTNSASSLFSSLLRTMPRHHPVVGLLFDALICVYADSGFLHGAVHCFRLVTENNLPFPVKGCENLLRHMTRLKPVGSKHSRAWASAWAFYLEVLDRGFPPRVYFFNVFMHGFCKVGDLGNARLVFDEIPKRGVRPTVVSFNTLISGYCRCGSVEEGFTLKGVMESEGFSPDVFTFSALINGVCKEGRLDEGGLVFDEMCNRGLVPNGVTFTTLIDGQCKGGKVDLALKNFEMMLAQGVRPDLVTYNALIHGLCKAGDLKEARRLVSEMSASGLKPDKITFTTLIDGCCKDGDMKSALELKKKMVEEGIELDDVAFTALISGLCRDGRVDDAERMLRDMMSAGFRPDDPTYTMVVDCFCKKGDVKMGFKLLKEMQSNGHVPGVVTYNALMNGLCKQGQMKNAKMLLDAMLNLGVAPNDITYNILLDGHSKHEGSGQVDMFNFEKGLVTDYASYIALVNKLSKTSKDRLKR